MKLSGAWFKLDSALAVAVSLSLICLSNKWINNNKKKFLLIGSLHLHFKWSDKILSQETKHFGKLLPLKLLANLSFHQSQIQNISLSFHQSHISLTFRLAENTNDQMFEIAWQIHIYLYLLALTGKWPCFKLLVYFLHCCLMWTTNIPFWEEKLSLI